MVRWLEEQGYDLSYLADPDLEKRAAALPNYRALLIVGWSPS